jgi:hypothetical protein
MSEDKVSQLGQNPMAVDLSSWDPITGRSYAACLNPNFEEKLRIQKQRREAEKSSKYTIQNGPGDACISFNSKGVLLTEVNQTLEN